MNEGTFTQHYINIEFNPATWTKSVKDGRSSWTSPPIELPSSVDEATALIYFDGEMVGFSHGCHKGPIVLSTEA